MIVINSIQYNTGDIVEMKCSYEDDWTEAFLLEAENGREIFLLSDYDELDGDALGPGSHGYRYSEQFYVAEFDSRFDLRLKKAVIPKTPKDYNDRCFEFEKNRGKSNKRKALIDLDESLDEILTGAF